MQSPLAIVDPNQVVKLFELPSFLSVLSGRALPVVSVYARLGGRTGFVGAPPYACSGRGIRKAIPKITPTWLVGSLGDRHARIRVYSSETRASA